MFVFLKAIHPMASQVPNSKRLSQAGQAWDDDKHYYCHCYSTNHFLSACYIAGTLCSLSFNPHSNATRHKWIVHLIHFYLVSLPCSPTQHSSFGIPSIHIQLSTTSSSSSEYLLCARVCSTRINYIDSFPPHTNITDKYC